MVWTGLFEIYRRSLPLLTYVDANGVTKVLLNGDPKTPMSDLSWAAALPQYLINSLAGVFIYIPSYDLYYSEIPARMRGTSMALGAFATSMGNTLLSAVILVWEKYIPANLNTGHMEYMHFTLAPRLGMLPEVDAKTEHKHQDAKAVVLTSIESQ